MQPAWPRLYNAWLRMLKGRRRMHPLARANLQALNEFNWDLPSQEGRYAVIDLETTGLDPFKDKVVSMGGFKVVDGAVKMGDVFNQLVNPGRDIPVESIKVHAVTPSMIEAAKPLGEVLYDFLDWMGNDIMVAHYAVFDLTFINREMKSQFGFRLQNPVLDTVLMCRTALIDPDPYGGRRGAKRCSLDALSERFNINVPERHTALGDALTTALILLCLLRELNKGGWSTLEDLIRVAGTW
jgi:DNA polymerase-3 subunit epsilon